MSADQAVLPQKYRQLNVWTVAVFAVFLLAVLEYAGLLRWPRAGAERMVQPFLASSAQVVRTVRLPAEWLRIATKKYSYVLDLELRYAESAAQLSEFDRVRKENEALRALLEYEQASGAAQPRQRKIASVLSYAQPTISLGQDDGIKEGYLVFVHGALVGKISKASAHEAQVKLLAAFSDTDVLLVQTEVGVSGLVSGDGRDVVMREIPIDAAIQIGQRIETSGQVGVLPQLYIGRILAIRRDEGSPTQTAVIDPGVSFYRTSIVEVSP